FCLSSAESAFFALRLKRSSLEPIPPEPPVAPRIRRKGAEHARARRFGRGEANPCARAPFWHSARKPRRADSVGRATSILLVGLERSSVFLPPFHRAPETKRFRPGFDDVRAVRDAV